MNRSARIAALAAVAAVALAGSSLVGVVAATPAQAVTAVPAKTVSTTYGYDNGATQSFTVPSFGVTSVTIAASGGGGGAGQYFDGAAGGGGAQVTATLAVTPGEVLNVVVGAGASGLGDPGTGPYGGGYGGGATGVDFGGSGGNASVITASGTTELVAGGGGGGGGGLDPYPSYEATTGGPGGGGGQPTGGAGGGGTGAYSTQSVSAGGQPGYYTTYGQTGGIPPGYPVPGGGGGGGGGGYSATGGGGGGGGQALASAGGGGGAGGDSYVSPSVTNTSYGLAGNGGPTSGTGGSAGANGQIVVSFPQVATSTTLSSSRNPASVSQSTIFSVTVSNSDGGGTVTLTDNGSPMSRCTNLTLYPNPNQPHTYNAGCTYGASSLGVFPEGNNMIVASYTGDADYGPSSATLTEVVTAVPTSTTVSANTNDTTYGQPITLTAHVTPDDGAGDGQGTVAFTYTDYGSPQAIAGCGAQPLSGAVGGGSYTATCTTTALPPSYDDIVTATYSGDAYYGSSSGPTSSGLTVFYQTTNVSISTNANPSELGQPVTATATLTNTDGGGTVSFATSWATSKCGNQSLTEQSLGTYTVSCTFATSPPIGNNTIQASYTGDADYQPLGFVSFTQSVVAGPATSVTVTPTTATVAAGTAQTYQAVGYNAYGADIGNVTSASTFSITPDGSCTGATCTASVAGAHTVTATDGAATGTAALTVAAAVHSVIISQLRLSGPQGPGDQFVDLYNNTATPVPLAGWSLDYDNSNGALVTVPLPDQTVPAYGHYLVTGPQYSLLVTPDDQTSQLAIPANGGAQVVGPGDVVVDAVGMKSAPTGFLAGTGLTTPTSTSGQYAYVRVEAAGRPVDTGNNATDFQLVGPVSAGGVAGVASPQDLASPVQGNALAYSRLLDPGAAASATPNRILGPNNSTLAIRRTITNTSSSAITTLQLRITSITAQGGPPATTHAWLVPIADPTTTQQVAVASSTTAVLGLSPDQTSGSGWGTTYTVPLPGGTLDPGQSVSVELLFAVQQGGSYSFGYDADVTTSP